MQGEPPALRFYPEEYPSFQYEATRDRFEIVQTGECGEGLISKVTFQPGDIVFRFTGLALNAVTLFTLQQGLGQHIHDPYVMGKVLHSCSPNMICDMHTLTFTAVQVIRAGEFLTMDYDTTEDLLYRPFYCECGSPQCRGWIRGRLAQPIETEKVLMF